MRTFVLPQSIEFGDCDPAGIVYYPNFYRWFDRATHHMFAAVGWSFRQIRDDLHLIAWPLVETGARYRIPVTAGDQVEIRSTITEFHEKTFRIEHRIHRGDDLAVEGFEIRILAQQVADAPVKLRAVPFPEAMRRCFE